MTTIDIIGTSRRKLWLAAIKPPMYSVAIVPIAVGTAIAYRETEQFNAPIFWTFIISAVLILAWLNLSNDVFDSETGIDRNKLHSVVNLTGNKNLIFWISNLLLALGIVGILSIGYRQNDPIVIFIVAACCALGYSYQGPPFRLGYRGLGEIICFFTFGPMAVGAAYYSQAGTLSLPALAASILIGLTTSIILFCSHFHQVADDLAAGKKSPIVRLGTLNGSRVLTAVTAGIYPLTLLFTLLKIYPPTTLLIFLSLPIALGLVNHVRENHAHPAEVSNCKFKAVNLHFVSGVLLALAYFL